MASERWTAERMGDQGGRVAIVTGANSGIGFETARALVGNGAKVVLACRDATRAEQAAERIRAGRPAGSVTVETLDLASLSSIRAFTTGVLERFPRLDMLVNNAGVMVPPLTRTADGFELQIGTNHLGHFALTGLLLERLATCAGSRVVTVSSMAHRQGRIDTEDLNWERRRYRRWAAYGQSKLANLLFTRELQRRLTSAGASTVAVAAHPGWTGTNLQRTALLFRALNPVLAMPPWQGALPTLFAATGPVEGGGYYGPDGLGEIRGYPAPASSSRAARELGMAGKLWDLSVRLTGVEFEMLGPASRG